MMTQYDVTELARCSASSSAGILLRCCSPAELLVLVLLMLLRKARAWVWVGKRACENVLLDLRHKQDDSRWL
jgi:hypothetical protein